jgi:hypothetical protein
MNTLGLRQMLASWWRDAMGGKGKLFMAKLAGTLALLPQEA